MAFELSFAGFAWKNLGRRDVRAFLTLCAVGLAVGAFAGSVSTIAYAADTRAILAHARQSIETADYRATGRLVRIDASGSRTNYALKIKAHWFPGVLRALVEIVPPSGAAGNASHDSRLHILLEMRPDGQNTIRIAHPGDAAPANLPFEKWSESPFDGAFNYEDFLESQYYWQNQTILKEAKFGARDCDVLKSTPGGSDRTHYAEVQTWLDHTIGYPVYAEKTMKEKGVVKEFTYLGLRQTSGVWSASQIEAKIRGRAGSSLLMIERGSAKANLSAKDFSLAQLIHFEDRP
jgi:hypothetical protein